MFSSRTLVDTNSSRLMRLQTEERILSFILSNSIRSSNLRDHEAENRTVPGPGPGPGPSAEISNTNTNTARNTD